MRKWTAGLLVLAAIAFVGFTGCDTLFGEEEEDDPTGTFVVINETDYPITAVWIKPYTGTKPANTSVLGDSNLGSETIAAGAYKSFVLTTGNYQVTYRYYDVTASAYKSSNAVTDDYSAMYSFSVIKDTTTGIGITSNGSWGTYSSARSTNGVKSYPGEMIE